MEKVLLEFFLKFFRNKNLVFADYLAHFNLEYNML